MARRDHEDFGGMDLRATEFQPQGGAISFSR